MTKSSNRKTVAQIDKERLKALNNGEIETATLTECLAVDFAVLLNSVLPDIGEDAIRLLQQESKTGILKRMTMTGQLIHDRMGEKVLAHLANHQSDTVRGWACFFIGAIENMTIADRINAILPLADDSHFGVREWAWMAIRRHIAVDLEASIPCLAGLVTSTSGRIRRFASESIRPRGVWCPHLGVLKKNPELALAILEPLRTDPERYVQDSVSNWLNDASKDQPEWVREICQRWLDETPDNPNTKRIVSRALRSLKDIPKE